MEQTIMSTGVVLIGLTLVGLLVQILNQIRLMKTIDQIMEMEDRILTRILIANEAILEMVMESPPITMGDLILRDLEKQMTDMTHPTPENDMVDSTETQMARQGKGKVTE